MRLEVMEVMDVQAIKCSIAAVGMEFNTAATRHITAAFDFSYLARSALFPSVPADRTQSWNSTGSPRDTSVPFPPPRPAALASLRSPKSTPPLAIQCRLRKHVGKCGCRVDHG